MSKELLTEFLGRTLNMPVDEAASLLYQTNEDGTEAIKSDALENLLKKDTERITKFQTERQTYFDNGYKKAAGETLTKFEKDLRAKYQIESDKKGIELIDELLNIKLSSVTGAELDEEKIKRSKLYLDLQDRVEKEKKLIAKEWETKFQEREAQQKKEKDFNVVSKTAIDKVLELKPVLSSDKAKADRQLGVVVNELKKYEYQINEDGKILVLENKGGVTSVKEDSHGNVIPFEKFVTSLASEYFDFATDTRSSAGNSNNASTTSTSTPIVVPAIKDVKDFQEAMSKAQTKEEKQAIIAKYYEKKK